jgi:hypothetical protein
MHSPEGPEQRRRRLRVALVAIVEETTRVEKPTASEQSTASFCVS